MRPEPEADAYADGASGGSRGLAGCGREALRPHAGWGGLEQREEAYKALHRRPVALDLQVPRAQRRGEVAALVNQPGQDLRVRHDSRVGSIRGPAFDLELPVGHDGAEDVLAKP